MEAFLAQPGSYLGLVALWAAYFAVHSALAARGTKARAARLGRTAARAYRLAYNLAAVLLLLPPLWLTTRLGGPMILEWRGPAWWAAQAAALLAVAGFAVSLRAYDMRHFLGLRQWRKPGGGVEPRDPLRISGFHRFLRHPWYFFGLVVLWTRSLDLAQFLTALSVTAYLVIGSRLEERKLIHAYGAAYRAYRRRVPGLVPVPGRYLTRSAAQRLSEQAKGERAP
ncbi:methyltransferase family protein [Thiohalorhabdus sp. Cl-TMA]|uniref:Isoprenylcysteine carboxylmethyltransferase family protein n=1 Tax=Thiohalorhabdus methylotrophus TaxID=3242694 RepID=A0ABV4TS39_9GAMM